MSKFAIISFVLIIFLTIIVAVIYSNIPAEIKVTNQNVPDTKSTDKRSELVFFGDSGSGTGDQLLVANAVSTYCTSNNCEAGVILGDVIYDNGVSSAADIQFKTKFEDVYASVNLPLYIVLGNHDYLGCIECYLQYAAKSAKWIEPARYYSHLFSNGLIEIFVIDNEKFDDAQASWLSESLSDSKAHWKVVATHRPLLSYEKLHYQESWSGMEKFKSIICDKADLLVSGHAHALEDVGPLAGCSVRQIVSGGGGAELREFVSPNLDIFASSSFGFLVIGADSKSLIFQFRSPYNVQLYAHTLTK